MKNSLNILYLHRTQGSGVEAVHIFGIANAFRSFGHKVDVFSPGGMQEDGQPNGNSNNNTVNANNKGHSLLSKYTPELVFELLEIAYNLVALFKLRQAGVKKYDLVYERYAIFSIVGMVLAKIRNIPFVLEVNYTSKSPLVRKRSPLLKPLAFIVDKAVFNTATLLTPVSSTLKRELIEQYGIAAEKIIVLPNAADPDKFMPKAPLATKLNDKKIIGFVGGFYPWHGLDLLVDAFNGIHQRIPEAQVMLVGDGPELGNIKNKVARLGLSEKIVFAGRKDHSELPELIGDFYVGVMPDSNDYGSPMKIFEYMAFGVPVIAPDYAPILDVMSEGRQGFVFKRGHVDELADRLERLLLDTELRNKFSNKARTSVEKTHNWNNNGKLILSSLLGAGQVDA